MQQASRRMRSPSGHWIWVLVLLTTACVCPDALTQPEDDPSIPPSDEYVQTKATMYGSGGIFIQVDVTDPEKPPSYTNQADIKVWTGTGAAPATTPSGTASNHSPSHHDLPTRRWSGGTTVWYDPGSDDEVWVFIEVKNWRDDGTFGTFNHNYTFDIDAVPVDWVTADPL